MRYRTTNPLLKLLLLLGSLAMLGAALIFGAVLLVVLLGIGAILAVVLWVRFSLMQGLSRPRGGSTGGPKGQGEHRRQTVIEGEYREVQRTGKEARRQDDSRE